MSVCEAHFCSAQGQARNFAAGAAPVSAAAPAVAKRVPLAHSNRARRVGADKPHPARLRRMYMEAFYMKQDATHLKNEIYENISEKCKRKRVKCTNMHKNNDAKHRKYM